MMNSSLARSLILRHSAYAAAVAVILIAISATGCRNSESKSEPKPVHTVSLLSFGLPETFFGEEPDFDCTTHIIGYRFLIWLAQDRVAVGFNTTPNCRSSSGQAFQGIARILVFDLSGSLTARRDLSYDADGGEELVAPGKATPGPDGTLLFRIEEAGRSKSGVLVLDSDLKDVVRIDRFMETPLTIGDHALVFQQGFVTNGPRTYDILTGHPPFQLHSVTEGWPTGTMDSKVGSHSLAYALCEQEFSPNGYQRSNIIYTEAHRRCTINSLGMDGAAWSTPLPQDQVAEIVGLLADGSIAGIVRAPKGPDQLSIWSRDQSPQYLPWFPSGYETTLQSATAKLSRYQGYGTRSENLICRIASFFCADPSFQLMIFDRRMTAPIVDRNFPKNACASLSPDGLHYATFESGEVRIYSLPDSK